MKNYRKLIVMLLFAAVCALCLAACGNNDKSRAKVPNVAGNTYVFESGTEDGEPMDAAYLNGTKYTFAEDGKCTYTMTFGETSVDAPATYKQEGTTVTVTMELGEEDEEPVVMNFKIDGDKITFTEVVPAYDDDGNAIDGKTVTNVLVYKKA